MKNLVSFDFSNESLSALKLGVQLSSRLENELTVLHSIGLHSYPYHESEEIKQFNTVLLSSARQEIDRYLEKNIKNFDGIQVRIKEGKPASEILKANKEQDVAFTILGRKDKAIPEKVGSTLRDIIRYAKGSVISVKKDLDLETVKRIAFVTNFEPTPTEALLNVVKIQELTGADLNLLYINNKENFKSSSEVSKEMESFCKLHHLTKTDLSIVNSESLEQGIIDFLASNPVDILAIRISASDGKLELYDSHLSAERLMDHTDLPIMTYSKKPFR